MTSEGEVRKTSEFLRRRKLRLQQVREQSKDIAKLIRQRAEVEQLKQVVELDAKKKKTFLQRQEKVVKKLEELYSKGLKNIGTSHTDASELNKPDFLAKTDLARQRGKEAAAELKRKKQQKLNEQKQSLDRKVQAREAANVISREKSTTIANKLSTKSCTSKFSDEIKSGNKSTSADKSASINLIDHCEESKDLNKEVSRHDMATQWDTEILPNEWEPNIPVLAIPKDDSTKDTLSNDIEKQKRPNLFALSDDMPSNLRGTHHNDKESSKPSLTLVSEYIQNRALRLREPEVPKCNKKQSQDLQTLKQTILRTRSSNPQGSAFSNICHVLEGQTIPVPTWHAETCCRCCSTNISRPERCPTARRQFANVTNSQINKIFSSVRPGQTDTGSVPVLRRVMPFLRNKYSTGHQLSAKLNNAERLFREDGSENGQTKKKSVTMYNHSTRDTRDVPFTDEQIVIRDMNSDKDAYSEALNETTTSNNKDKQNKKMQDMINTIAMTRQHVEKEYKDTMAFLSGLPKTKGLRPINRAYKDDQRLQMQSENRQRTLQQEFKKVENESRQGMACRAKSAVLRNQRRKSSSATGDNFNERDFQYAWMPVPEGDGNLAVHAIPTAVKEGKTGNSVKFSKVDSYHEYRSRHKHTPPTKDTSSHDRKVNKRYVEAVIIQQKDDNNSSSSVTSNNSIEDLRLGSKENKNAKDDDTIRELTDAERIIIYKILDYKKHDKSSKKLKTDDATQNSNDNENEKERQSSHDGTVENLKQQKENTGITRPDNKNAFPTDYLNEGLYRIDSAKGDNIASMYYADGQPEGDKHVDQSNEDTSRKDNINNGKQFGEGQHCSRDSCSDHQRSRKHCNKGDDDSTSKNQTSNLHPALITSTTSFKTATNVKLDCTQADGGYVNLVDEGGKEKGNIYIGATGLLRDDAYEVVIQLRKKGIKDSENREEVMESQTLDVQTDNAEKITLTSVQPSEIIQKKPKNIQNYSEAMDFPQTTPSNQKPVNITSDTADAHLVQNDINIHPKGSKNSLSSFDKIKHDKSVSRPLEDTNPISNIVPKTAPSPRPATSAYTQTTHGSPNPRPVFVHMSSSTSTAYMSPPEVIFPKYFRRYESSDEVYQNVDRDDDRHIMYEQQPFCEVYPKCRCRRCVGRRAYFKKVQTIKENRLKTPPNTARSIDTEIGYDSYNFDNMNKRSSRSSPVSTRYNKCKIKGKSKLCCKYQKNQSQVLLKRNIKTSVLYNRKGKISSNTSKNTSKSYLNPMIKDYINKLLSLNREGIKAIQVMNQECSSVNTPANSILNIPSNVRNNKPDINALRSQISLEQIKNFIREQIFENYSIPHNFGKHAKSRDFKSGNLMPKHLKTSRRKWKKKKNHKVKNLNISKKIRMNTNYANFNESSTYFAKRNNDEKNTMPVNSKSRSKSYASLEHIENHREINSNGTGSKNFLNAQNKQPTNKVLHARKSRTHLCDDTSCDRPKTVTSSGSTSPDSHIVSALKRNRPRQPIHSSTQTSCTIDNEISFMKLAEDKLQNMEKIANLTEKCTKRLSNLAKVLEEVRKNKSIAYSQISNSDSTDCDQKSEKPVIAERIDKQSSNLVYDVKEKTELKSPSTVSSKEGKELDSTDYETLLFDIPKARYIESPHSDYDDVKDDTSKTTPSGSTNIDYRFNNTKCRSKPPPALLRIHLKRAEENIVPHELSTVIEVDSPMSVKLKNQSSNIDNAKQSKNLVESRKEEKLNINDSRNEQKINPELRQSTANNNGALKIISTDSSDDSKLRMMDLNQFNEIMLRPFISLREYAQEYYADDVVAKRETVFKDKVTIEDVSSLHSDGSLPDVVAELLKRKLITEPFKFDSASNVNSTTVSSESTLSVLALSRARKDKGNQKIIDNKENVTETSDTLSISSNPDLENAFKKLGMGWASSTLKKTKERLALSSSSNTSSSSMSQFKFKNSSKQDMPTLVTESVSSVPNLVIKTAPDRYTDISKNAEQQTSLTNSMTVKEFLTKELAKKITFTNKSDRNQTNEEFVSLLETKMPEELKNSCQTIIEDNSADSVPSANNNRARTSTPVQIFKSVTYHSSSSSNISNGLFSNADDLSSVKLTSTSMRYHSTSEKDELTVPNYSLKMRKGLSDCSKTDSY